MWLAGEGILCIKGGWPGALRTIFGDHERFEKTYFSTFKVAPHGKRARLPTVVWGCMRYL